jgi:hypothetical protein
MHHISPDPKEEEEEEEEDEEKKRRRKKAQGIQTLLTVFDSGRYLASLAVQIHHGADVSGR